MIWVISLVLASIVTGLITKSMRGEEKKRNWVAETIVFMGLFYFLAMSRLGLDFFKQPLRDATPT